MYLPFSSTCWQLFNTLSVHRECWVGEPTVSARNFILEPTYQRFVGKAPQLARVVLFSPSFHNTLPQRWRVGIKLSLILHLLNVLEQDVPQRQTSTKKTVDEIFALNWSRRRHCLIRATHTIIRELIPHIMCHCQHVYMCVSVCVYK